MFGGCLTQSKCQQTAVTIRGVKPPWATDSSPQQEDEGHDNPEPHSTSIQKTYSYGNHWKAISPQEQLRGDSSHSSSGSGVGGSQAKEGGISQASQGLQSHTTSLTPWVNNCPWEPKLGSRDVPEPLRWVLCLPAVAWPAQRTNFVSQFYSFCNFASNTCPMKYSNIKEMSNLENETPLSPTQITYS